MRGCVIGAVRRSDYIKQLHESKDVTGIVKVITGMRRCGKSTLMEQFIEDLRSEGVDDGHTHNDPSPHMVSG